MTSGLFTIYDSKAETFLQPFFSISAGTAVREFTAAADTADHAFNKYAGDYTLFHIAEWDEVAGHIEMFHAHINLGTALSLKTQPAMPRLTTPLLPEDEAKSA